MPIVRQSIPIAAHNLTTSVSGTWSYVAPTSTVPAHFLKTAVAENGILSTQFSLWAERPQFGARLLGVEAQVSIRTADLTGVLVGSLTRHNLWRATTRPTQTFTVNVDTDLLTVASTALPLGTAVTLTTSGTLPTGLATGTTYFVGNINGLTCQLFTSLQNALSSASPVEITGAGSGTHNILQVEPESSVIAVTESGTQVSSGTVIRTYRAEVTSPVFEALDAVNLRTTTAYGFVLTAPTAATTVYRIHNLEAYYDINTI